MARVHPSETDGKVNMDPYQGKMLKVSIGATNFGILHDSRASERMQKEMFCKLLRNVRAYYAEVRSIMQLKS